MKAVTILICALLIATNCHAFGFKCIVKGSYTLEDNGVLREKHNSNEEFIVNRQSGQMTGSAFVNTMSGQKPIVLDYLPEENSYKAITIYEPNPTVDYLQINTYKEGKEKPFIYKGAWGKIVTGVCTSY